MLKLGKEITMQLTLDQIAQLFDELKIPRALAAKGSPIDIVCPNESLHTRHDGRASCRLWFDNCPHLYCFHAHCYEANQELNLWLRLHVLGTSEFPDDFLPEEGEPKVPADYLYAKAVAGQFPKLLRQFRKTNPTLQPIAVGPVNFLRRLRVFKSDDLIWIGRENSSGRSMHATHFRTLEQWESLPPSQDWSFTTGAAFLPGTFRRAKANVKAVRALILESDSLSMEDTFAIARWVEDEFSLPLLAAVSSGNKSLHCYFRYPGQDWVDCYGPALISVGFDRRTFSPVQPVRLARQRRADNGAVQLLLWIGRPKPRARKPQHQRST
jgi:hypothetical protein